MKIPKFFPVGLAVLALASTATAQTFFDAGITLQSKTIDLGNAGRIYKWAALSRDGNVSATTSSNTSPANIDFDGNVGIWGSSANLYLSNSRIQGNVFIRTGGTTNFSGSGGLSGTISQNAATNTILSTAATHIDTLSNNINSLTKTTNFSLSGFMNNTPSALTKIIAAGSGDNTSSINLTINGTVNNPLNNPIVLKLSDFILNEGGGTQLTLVGTAMTKFIINVTGQFSLSGSADVLLSGGLLAGNVIFNSTGSGGAGLGGASTLKGILIAKNGTASLSGASTITGQVIGKTIALSGGSKIKKPVVSP
ncbi:MAG: hypothetical protein H7Y43_04625 [Akkermansiaceae bacterium]|nr:hypothetical protein [Verrucomicrobiales bacterium]